MFFWDLEKRIGAVVASSDRLNVGNNFMENLALSVCMNMNMMLLRDILLDKF